MILKKLVFIGLVLSILSILSFKLISNNKNNILKNKGKEFYEEYYYPSIDNEGKEIILSSFLGSGIKINLYDLIKYDKNIEKKFNQCNLYNTYVLIYPNKPYKKSDYKIKTKLNC